jgi:hypothetical protein
MGPSGPVGDRQRASGPPSTPRLRGYPARDLLGGRARGSRDRRGVSEDPGLGERSFEERLFGGDARAGAFPRTGSGSASSRLVRSRWVSSEAPQTSAAGFGGAPPGSDVSVAIAARPLGVARRDGAQTTGPAGSRRAEGAGDTLEAGQGQERMPDRFTATRQLGCRTPRRVRAVTLSRREAPGGCAQPIRR